MNAAGVSCYVGDIPEFVEQELAARYETLHSSLPFFRVWRSLGNVSCYVDRSEGGAPDILLFHCEHRRLVVLNEMIDIAPAALERFVRYVFEHLPEIDVIRFDAVRTTQARIGFPVQQHNAKETWVIPLPATADDYLAALGKSTRTKLRSHLNGISKNFPSFTVKYLEIGDIDEAVVRHIARLSEQRIGTRGVRLKHDVERMLALARTCGLVTLLMIDGRLCAGSLNYRVGTSWFGEVTAHDPGYDRHGLGTLCMYHTICESIRRGGRKFYLGGGRFEFKERMLGQRLDMDQLHFYRSHRCLLVNLDIVAGAFAHGKIRRLKVWLHERKGTWFADLVFRLFHAYRNKAGA
jgi:hypothetical protein